MSPSGSLGTVSGMRRLIDGFLILLVLGAVGFGAYAIGTASTTSRATSAPRIAAPQHDARKWADDDHHEDAPHADHHRGRPGRRRRAAASRLRHRRTAALAQARELARRLARDRRADSRRRSGVAELREVDAVAVVAGRA